MSDLVINVRQIGNYPAVATASPTDTLLLQRGGLGGSYMSIEAGALVATALQGGVPSLSVGVVAPGNDAGGGVFSTYYSALPGAGLRVNCYDSAPGVANYLVGGPAMVIGQTTTGGMQVSLAGAGSPQSPITAFPAVLNLSLAGAMSLPYGTLTVARDPAAAQEVATMGWVGRNTVASFNGRRGVVRLGAPDIYQALCLDSPIATQGWVNQAIQSGLQSLLTTCPFVNRWNGRTGSVWLMLSDISCVFMQPGQQPISQTPPTGSNDNSIATTAWVVAEIGDLVAQEITAANLATEAWVQANTVASFNGRVGVVTLSTQDIVNAGGAPIISPQFYGTPTALTANPGTSTGQLATTAFVMAAVQSAVTGVISFNTRTGAIELEAQDIYDAGGALQQSPAFSGTPTAPTAPPATATTQLATCAFVMNEIEATTAGVASFNTRVGAVTLQLADVTGVGGAPIDSPAFSGQPTCPTPVNPVGASLNIANTNWVVQYVTLEMAQTVSSFNGRTGVVTLNANDLSAAGALVNPSPAMTGQPTAPTAVPGTNTTQLATCAFVTAAIAGLSGVTVSPTAPPSPYLGQAWFNTTAGVQQLYIWTGSGWTVSTNLAGYMPTSGGTFTGTVTLAANATQNLQPTTLQQMNAAIAPLATQAQLAGYLPLSGGTITGNLQVNGLTSFAGLGDFNMQYASPNRILNWAAGWSDVWNTQSGVRGWIGPSGLIMSLNSAGDLATTGSINAATTLISSTTGVVYAPWQGNGVSFSWNGNPAASLASIRVAIDNTIIGGGSVVFGYPNLISLNWNGNLYAFIDGGNAGQIQLTASDARLKENIAVIEVDCLAAVNRIGLRQFDWKPTDLTPERPHATCGMIAQDVQEIIPEAVNEHPEDGMQSVDLMPVVAYLIGAVQQIAGELTALKRELGAA